MKRIAMLVTVLVAILAAIAGCTLFQVSTPLHVVALTKYVHPVSSLGGFPVTLQVTGGSGQYTVDWGDGTIDHSLSHLYVPPIQNQYIIVLKSGGMIKTTTIHVENNPPVIYPPFVIPSKIEWKGKTLIDLRYREHGCHNGAPVSVTGIYDPDGDHVSLVIHILTGGTEDTVFDENRQPINGKPVPVGVYYWFPGWQENTPPYPFSPQAAPVPTKPVVIQITATDQWGAKSTAEFDTTVDITSCTGGKKQ